MFRNLISLSTLDANGYKYYAGDDVLKVQVLCRRRSVEDNKKISCGHERRFEFYQPICALLGSSTLGTMGHRLWPKNLDTTGSLQQQMAGEPYTSYWI
jgi:hypothetical protein